MQRITIELTRDEAVVLFELLARDESATGIVAVEHEAERKVLWILEGLLENVLVEPLRSDYRDLVETARKNVLAEPAR
jgi:hypothetical protein